MTVQSVKFSNEKIRPAADMLAQFYNFANTVVDEWNALGGVALIPNTTEEIPDGSTLDGRTVITGADASIIIDRLNEFVTAMEANSNARLYAVLKVAVNPTR